MFNANIYHLVQVSSVSGQSKGNAGGTAFPAFYFQSV